MPDRPPVRDPIPIGQLATPETLAAYMRLPVEHVRERLAQATRKEDQRGLVQGR